MQLCQVNGKSLVSQKYPRANPIMPRSRPIRAMSRERTVPVECAIALGGVDMGNTMARDAPIAMKDMSAGVQPTARKDALFAAAGSDIPFAATIMIGISIAAVAELLMKFDNR